VRLEDYALVGDTQTAALVGRDGEHFQVGLDSWDFLVPSRLVDATEQVDQLVPVVRLGLGGFRGDPVRECPVELRPGAQ
jgi:hypothetical protein